LRLITHADDGAGKSSVSQVFSQPIAESGLDERGRSRQLLPSRSQYAPRRLV
jgi:hypothetical protein